MSLRPDPESFDHYELIGRYVQNALGQEEIVFLTRVQWDYLDWLVERGADVAQYIRTCDLKRQETPLSELLGWWVYDWFLERERQGYPRPDWLPAPEPWELDQDAD